MVTRLEFQNSIVLHLRLANVPLKNNIPSRRRICYICHYATAQTEMIDIEVFIVLAANGTMDVITTFGYYGAAVDSDIFHIAVFTCTDAHTPAFTTCIDIATIDDDIAAIILVTISALTATDACCIFSSIGFNGATIYRDCATTFSTISGTDASSIITAVCLYITARD